MVEEEEETVKEEEREEGREEEEAGKKRTEKSARNRRIGKEEQWLTVNVSNLRRIRDESITGNKASRILKNGDSQTRTKRLIMTAT